MTRMIAASLFWLFVSATLYAAPLTVSDINAALARQPSMHWVAKGNDAAAQFNGVGAFGLKYRPRFGGMRVVVPTPNDLPRRLDWRSVNGGNWVSPVRNQGRCGSCVAFAAAGTFESNYNIALNAPGFNFDASEQELLNQIGGCSGSVPELATDYLKTQGVPDEACYPYQSGRRGDDAAGDTCDDVAVRSIKITNSDLVGVAGVKRALQKGPVTAVMTVFEDFYFYAGGVYQHIAGDAKAGHALTLIGYNDDERYWIVKNSWGIYWGEAGFGRVSYDDVSGIGTENYTMSFEAPDSLIKLASPASYAATANVLNLSVTKPNAVPLASITVELSDPFSGRAVTDNIDQTTMSGQFDTATLADGVYQLKVSAQAVDGQVLRPWYSLLTVANHPQPIRVAISAYGFDPTLPVREDVKLLFDIAQQDVPLTEIKVEIAAADGTIVKRTSLPSPGAETLISLHNSQFVPGVYQVNAVGYIGNLQSFSAAPMSFLIGGAG